MSVYDPDYDEMIGDGPSEPGLVKSKDGRIETPDGTKAWSEANGGMFFAVKQTHEQIPTGVYNPIYIDSMGFGFKRVSIDTDELYEFPNSVNMYVLEMIDYFWSIQDKYKQFGFLHKRGMLLWGPPGSGKSCTLNLAIKHAISKGYIAVIASRPVLLSGALEAFRVVEPNRPALVVIEDFDELTDDPNDLQNYLQLLDGNKQIDHVLYLMTTNHPDQLDYRFTDRPSRIDTIQYVGPPSMDTRLNYLRKKNEIAKLPDDVLVHISSITEGLSLAHLKEVLLSVALYEKSADEVVAWMRKKNKFEEKSSSIGFGSKHGDGGPIVTEGQELKVVNPDTLKTEDD